MKTELFFSLICLLCLNLTSGLSIVNQSETAITKIAGQNTSFFIDIANDRSFTFYNISLTANPYLSFPVISELSSGQAARVNITLYSNENFNNYNFKVAGYYISDIGSSAENYTVAVDFYNGLSRCDFSVYKGDKITFNNLVADSIVLRNADTLNDITTIGQDQNYTMVMSYPAVLRYYFLRRGYIFTPECTITTLDTQGSINNPEYDGNFNLSSSIIYTPTSVNWSIPVISYTVDPYGSQEGVLSVTNTGSVTAKNVTLSGDWFVFAPNNFDIPVGVAKAVSFTISPVVADTNSTNKTYVKAVELKGNFNTLTQGFNIQIPYMNLDDLGSVSNYGSLIELLQSYCVLHPNETFCKDTPQYVYVYGNGTSTVSLNFTEEQAKGIFDLMFKVIDDLSAFQGYDKDWKSNITDSLIIYNNRTANLEQYVYKTEADRKNSFTFVIYLLAGGIIIVIALIMVVLIFTYKKINKLREIKRF